MKWFVRKTWCNKYDLLMNISSTCFGHHYAHLQERKAVYNCIRFSALNVLAEDLASQEACRVHSEKADIRITASQDSSQHIKCWKPYAVIEGIELLKMGLMVPDTCWTKFSLINHICCIKLVSQIISWIWIIFIVYYIHIYIHCAGMASPTKKRMFRSSGQHSLACPVLYFWPEPICSDSEIF